MPDISELETRDGKQIEQLVTWWKSNHAANLLDDAWNASVLGKFLREKCDSLVSVANLDLAVREMVAQLHFIGAQVVEKTVVVPAPKTKRELHDEYLARTAKAGISVQPKTTEFDRVDAGRRPTPNNDELAIIASRDLEYDAQITAAREAISGYQGRTHSRTYSTRDVLNAELTRLIAADHDKDGAKILATIQAKLRDLG